MNSNEALLNSIFFPRPSFKAKDTNDHLVEVDDNIYVSVRLFLKDKVFPTILFAPRRSSSCPWGHGPTGPSHMHQGFCSSFARVGLSNDSEPDPAVSAALAAAPNSALSGNALPPS